MKLQKKLSRADYIKEALAPYIKQPRLRAMRGGVACYVYGNRRSPLAHLVPIKLLAEYEDVPLFGVRRDICSQELWEAVPRRYQALGRAFLHHVNAVHDNPAFWDRRGLTPEGWHEVCLLLKFHCGLPPKKHGVLQAHKTPRQVRWLC